MTFVSVQRDWSEIIRLWQGSDAPLLPYYLLAEVWVDLLAPLRSAGLTIGLLRSLSALLAAVAVLFTYLLARRFGGRLAGLVAAGILVVLPGMSRFAQEARPYALLMAVTAIAWWAFDLWMRHCGSLTRPARRRTVSLAVGLTLVLSLIPFASLFGLLQWGAMGIIALCFGPTPPASVSRGRWWQQRLKLCAPILAAAVISSLPVIHMASLGGGPRSDGNATIGQMARILTAVGFWLRDAPSWGPLILIALLAIAALGTRLPAISREIGIAWTWLIVVAVGGMAAGIIHPAFIRERYWLPLLLPAALMIGLAASQALSASSLPQRTRRWLSMGLATLVMVMLAVPSASLHGELRAKDGHGADMQPVVKRVRALQAKYPDATIMIEGNGASFYFAVPAPDLFESNMLLSADPTSVNVWRKTTPPDERAQRLEESSSVIWAHWLPTKPAKVFADLPVELEDAGLQKVSSKVRGENWEISLYTR